MSKRKKRKRTGNSGTGFGLAGLGLSGGGETQIAGGKVDRRDWWLGVHGTRSKAA